MKQTLYFGNPCYLSKLNGQLVVNFAIPSPVKSITTIPIEEIAIVILDHNQITITQALISELAQNNIALITCDQTHHPTGMILSINGNHLQSARFKSQISCSEKRNKNLWQQIIKQKILNQSHILNRINIEIENMLRWHSKVKPGDPENYESRSAIYYWRNIFDKEINFRRDRHGMPPNNLLNYGYSILRAMVARNIVSSGLLPTLGIKHSNKYNAFCLADDIMEPYRPFIDAIVCAIIAHDNNYMELSQENKRKLLEISSYKTAIGNQTVSVMNAIQLTCSSLVQYYNGETNTIIFPEF